jgi:hypothetical protein
MRRLIVTLAAVALCASVLSASPVKKYGKALTIKETTKISDILAKPDAFNGKKVKVQGPIIDVCSEKGCWIAVGGDKEFQSLRFKVDDGVIVFPMDAKGLTATVEGVVSVTVLSVADQIAAAKAGTSAHEMEMGHAPGKEMGKEAGKEMGKEMAKKEPAKPFDPKSITGPKTVIMIKGEAAEVF